MVKFDRSLLLMADQDANSRFMLDYFSTAFERLGYKVLYEGVETDARKNCVSSVMQIIYRAISSPSRFPLKNCPGSLRGADIAIAASIIIPDTASAVPAYTIKIPRPFHSLRDFSFAKLLFIFCILRLY